ncbi:triose-phosphate isomerase [Desulfoplanes formicivorans]|uniref:Triosephosphate isomerase n=1 Tax=Desulfoplanes formicivorans TaxID=1592317 RepID=A0A194AKH8_9BACT|nr:triose-phosphate isomerase [Desulfoplanes formicivorans]GAU09818.1 triosephosphate isomerase [Desulfoplanes formicivorans]
MKKLMAANWKMFKTHEEGVATAHELVQLVSGRLPDDREMLVIPPFTLLHGVGQVLAGHKGMLLGGENFYPADQGAFTGEICPDQLLDLGCTFALAGHSERRHILGETDDFVGRKVAFGLEKGLAVILCIGETIEERRQGRVEEVLFRQLDKGLSGVTRAVDPDRMVVAYEPVWAIGTGEVAGPEEIIQAHGVVRSRLVNLLGETGNNIRILYGGSVKPDNCASILALDNVDGVLVGGASLKAESFSRIVLA